jgi:hypothetical protein
MLVSDIIYQGYRISGCLTQAQRQASASEMQDGLLVLNSMVDAMLNESLLVWAFVGNTFDLVPNKISYTLGIGGDLNIPRPTQIFNCEFTYTTLNPPVQQQFRILTDQEWFSLSPKPTQATPDIPTPNPGFQSTVPYYFYMRKDYPLATVFLWPNPLTNSQVGTFTIYIREQIQQFADINTPVILPPGYQAMLEYNLAVELAIRYPTRAKLSPIALQLAREKKAWVKNNNEVPLKMVAERVALGVQGGMSGFNILSNSWNSGPY